MSSASPGVAGIAAVTLDCVAPEALAAFWQALVGGVLTVDDDGDVRLVGAAGGWVLDFLHCDDPRLVKNRLHVDVASSDFERAVASALELGATRADDIYDGGSWQVLRDPEGNEFCILRPRGEGVAEANA